MFWSRDEERAATVNRYTTPADFCQLFETELNRFFYLALLLTADERKAEQCFTDALDDCLHSSTIFTEWAQRWAVHSIVKNAIRAATPTQGLTTSPNRTFQTEAKSDLETIALAIEALPTLDRFVFVMTLLENYSDRECASFIGCAVAEIQPARERAVRQLGKESAIFQEPWRARASA